MSILPASRSGHQFGAFIVQAAAPHIDRLDALLAALLHRLDMAVHQQLVVLHQPAERPQRQADGGERRTGGIAHVEHQPALLDRQMQRVRRRGGSLPVSGAKWFAAARSATACARSASMNGERLVG